MVKLMNLSTFLHTIDALINFILFLWSYGISFVGVVADLFSALPGAKNWPSLRIDGEDSGSGEWLIYFSLFFLSLSLFLLSLDFFFRGGGYSSILSVALSLASMPKFSSLRWLLMLLWVKLSFIPPFYWIFSSPPPLTSSFNASAVGAFTVLFASIFDAVVAASFNVFSYFFLTYPPPTCAVLQYLPLLFISDRVFVVLIYLPLYPWHLDSLLIISLCCKINERSRPCWLRCGGFWLVWLKECWK